MLTLLITLPLLLGPAETSTPTEATDAPAPAVEQPEFDAAVQNLQQSVQQFGLDPVASTDQLTEAIAALEQFAPALAEHEEARKARQAARLNLASTYLFAEDPVNAAKVMDEVIREAMGDEVPAANYGPRVADLYTERLEIIEQRGHAQLKVRCTVPCTVYVNEVEVPAEPPPLPLGTYRVWVADKKGKHAPVHESVDLTAPDQSYEVEFAPIQDKPEPKPPPAPPKRIMPREGQIALIIIGTGLVTTGGVLAGLGKGNPGRIAGGALSLVAGGALLTTGIVTLSVDEVRLARWTGHQATLNWTMKF